MQFMQLLIGMFVSSYFFYFSFPGIRIFSFFFFQENLYFIHLSLTLAFVYWNLHFFCQDGPDILVCDEAHMIKNTRADVTQALKQVKCQRRIALTGSPLQNNLMEYYCVRLYISPFFYIISNAFHSWFLKFLSGTDGRFCKRRISWQQPWV